MSTAAKKDWSVQALLGEWLHVPVPDMNISGVCLDSRLVVSGDLYLAVAGATTHGIHHVDAAMVAGARAVAMAPAAANEFAEIVDALRQQAVPVLLVEALDERCAAIASRFYGNPDKDMTLIAVTGTDGKTSVCRFITQAMQAADLCCGYIGTVGWGLGEYLQPVALTTPDAVSIRRMLASLRDQGATLVALEASSHGLAEGRLDGLALDVAVLTNLGRDHLDYHKTIEAYKAAKARLFDWPALSACVVNGEDAFGRELLASARQLTRYAYYSHQQPDSKASLTRVQGDVVNIHANAVNCTDAGLVFEVREKSLAGKVITPLLGHFNVDNLLACYGTLRACGVAANEAIHCLSDVKPVDGRMERFGGAGRPTVVVDFSHTPQALELAINAARVHCVARLWVVFGCGGDRDPGKRAPMAAAAEAADCVILTDDNPRTEASQTIIDQTMQGFSDTSHVTVIADRAAAIQHAVTTADQDDLVLIAGKGHEDYQIIGTTRHPFSDREQVLAALELAS